MTHSIYRPTRPDIEAKPFGDGCFPAVLPFGDRGQDDLFFHRDMTKQAFSKLGIRLHLDVVEAVQGEITRAASTAEFVIVGRLGWSARPGNKIGSVTRALIERGSESLLMVEQGGIQEPLAVLYDGSPASKRALSLVSALCGPSDNSTTVIVRGESASQQLEDPVPNARVEIVSDDLADLQKTLRRCGARTILLPAPATALIAIRGILEQANLSVFLVH